MVETKSELELLNVAAQEKWNILDILLNSVALFRFDVDAKNARGDALVHILAEKNALLLEKTIESGANVNLPNRDGKTALHVAAEVGNQRAVRSLVKIRADQNIKDALGETPIFKATRNCNYEIVRHLLDSGSFASVTNNEGCNLLHLAASNGDRTEIIQLLLALKQIKTNQVDNQRRTPLHVACAKGNVAAAKLLIANDAAIDCQMLHVAVQRKHAAMAKVLLQMGIDADCRNANGETPLHLAVENDSLEIVRLLLDEGAACVNLTDEDGYAPLHVACEIRTPDFVNILLAEGALINLQTLNGDSPLHRAASRGNLPTTVLLLNQDAAAAVNLANNDGRAPIHLAGDNGHISTVEYLVSRGADVHLLDKYNQSPLATKINRSAGMKSNLPKKIIRAGTARKNS